ncbi:MAG: hypothetical protein ABW168_08735 [Sedimenticola sp.]
MYLEKLPSLDIKPLVADPTDKALLQLAQLDCDWDGENLRCYSQLSHPELQFEPAKIVGILGLQELVEEEVEPDVTPWLVMISQHPHKIEPVIDRILTLFTRKGGKVFYWAYDEASRYMPSFARVAKYLNILVHDEMPLDQAASASLNPTCITLHSSPLANMIPYAHPFIEEVNKQIVFLCSSMGLTGHRKKQVDHLQKHFKDRFLAIYDHSIPMNQRGGLAKYKAHLCPEGRTFTTPAMRYTHTDRPFWSGCLGQIPVIEDSWQGGRLQELVEAELVLRYSHGDLASMTEACEQALEATPQQRRRVYEHFNTHGYIGAVVAQMIAAETFARS